MNKIDGLEHLSWGTQNVHTVNAERVHGNAYTEDLEYMNGMMAAPVMAVIYDWTIRQWRKVKMQPLAGHRDRPAPVDVDAMIDQELPPPDPHSGMVIAKTRAEKKLAAHYALFNYFTAHGPQLQYQLGRLVGGYSNEVLLSVMVDRPEKYVQLWSKPHVWGLIGQEWKR